LHLGKGNVGPASVTAVIDAVSCSGKKPFGAITYMMSVAAMVANVTTKGRALALQHPQQRAMVEATVRSMKRLTAASPGTVISSPTCFKSREHIIGVSVSDTIAEVTTAIVSVSANSRNMRPTSRT
jgi:hypothetical protein